MVSDVTIGVWLIVLAGTLVFLIVATVIAAARSIGKPNVASLTRGSMSPESGQCVYDCMVWFREKTQLVQYCGRACGIASPLGE